MASRFIYIGLDKLTDRQLIASGRLVRGITSSGISKIQRNIGAIQQALRNMLPGGSAIVLNRSVQYWHMYEMGPQVRMLPLLAWLLAEGSDTSQL
jgi:hypothetical protein